VKGDEGRCVDVAVFCDLSGEPRFVRIRLCDVPDEMNQDAFGPLLITAREHVSLCASIVMEPKRKDCSDAVLVC